MKVSHDRGAIIDFIGKQHGSPALKKGSNEPAIVTGHEATDAVRVGWAAFFAEVNRRKLALAYDLASGEHKWVARGSQPEAPSPGQVSTGVGNHPTPHA
jgi:hypothetical protein